MRILSFFIGHDASATILENGRVSFYLSAERITRKKHCDRIIHVLKYLHKHGHRKFDVVLVNLYRLDDRKFEEPLKKLFKEEFQIKRIEFDYERHHIYHAYSGFCNSKFKDALCIVLDGHGSAVSKDGKLHTEIESVYYANKKDIVEVSKKYSLTPGDNQPVSVGYQFEKLSREIGWDWYGAGKIMGLAQYKDYENKLDKEWLKHLDQCSEVQRSTQEEVISLIQNSIQKYDTKNIVLSGGYGLNCVANYEYLNHFPDYNFYIDPVCFDAGISIGQAYYHSKNPKPMQNFYIGLSEKRYNVDGLNHRRASYSDIADILCAGEIVAIFQGKSEAGQRALGNRSLLFDPRVDNGRDIVNQIKQRESFRPFAGTVLLEDADEWFDMRGLKECEYMQYAVKVKRTGIDAVVHVDNTCRIQTVTKRQNKHFYNLIKAFKQKTKVPILLNTSFNLGGEPLAETFDDAIKTLNKSNINYLYLPEIGKLVYCV
jgi:carbamoyltransferase